MKRVLSILILGTAIAACGEQFQGSYFGSGVITENTCNSQNVGDAVNMTVSLRLSGSSADFLVTEFKRAHGGELNSDVSRAVRSLRFKSGVEGDTRLVPTNTKYFLSESAKAQYMRSLGSDNLSQADLDLLEYDEIFADGNIRTDREVIETLRVQYFTQAPRDSSLLPCTISFETDSNGLSLIK